ncbi:MAG: hypothetical protein IKB74_05265, partial [Lentisphaeria bacterium]|nr:hypothetical protein [Lentisphaeria bacterium]
MKKLITTLIMASFAILHGAVNVRTAELKLHGKQLILENKLSGDWKKAPLSLSLYDGKAKKFLQLPAPEISESAGKITLAYRMPDLEWQITFSARSRVILGESTFINKGKDEKFLEQFITLKTDFNTKDLRFWDGFGKTRAIGDKLIDRKGIKGAVLPHISASDISFAASAVYSDDSALSIGHVTFDPVSYTAVTYDPASGNYSYSQRFVLSGGEKLPLRHVIVSSTSDYGAPEGVIQQHYDSFPEVWAVAGGQDNPYAWGNCAHYRNWWDTPRPEESRRLQYTHDWAYAPYRRAGDMMMKKELFDYKPDNEIVDRRRGKFGGYPINYKTTSRDEFLRVRKERYLKYGKRYGWMFYNNCSGVWCERQLAEKYYPDSLTKDPKTVTLIKGWSTGHDWEVRVFPMGTSWAAAFERDMKEIAEDLDLPGFALDCGDAAVARDGFGAMRIAFLDFRQYIQPDCISGIIGN